jgi:hypothetical protein
VSGVEKAELQYTMLGVGVCIIAATILSLAVPLLVPGVNTLPFSPLATIPMTLMILYGIGGITKIRENTGAGGDVDRPLINL